MFTNIQIGFPFQHISLASLPGALHGYHANLVPIE